MDQFPYKSCRRRRFDDWGRVDDKDDVKAFIRRMREQTTRERETAASTSAASAVSVSGLREPKKRLRSEKMTITEKESDILMKSFEKFTKNTSVLMHAVCVIWDPPSFIDQSGKAH